MRFAEGALGLRQPTGHSFVDAHHLVACPLALTLITERGRLTYGNPRT
jgi:hypothetical protein